MDERRARGTRRVADGPRGVLSREPQFEPRSPLARRRASGPVARRVGSRGAARWIVVGDVVGDVVKRSGEGSEFFVSGHGVKTGRADCVGCDVTVAV